MFRCGLICILFITWYASACLSFILLSLQILPLFELWLFLYGTHIRCMLGLLSQPSMFLNLLTFHIFTFGSNSPSPPVSCSLYVNFSVCLLAHYISVHLYWTSCLLIYWVFSLIFNFPKFYLILLKIHLVLWEKKKSILSFNTFFIISFISLIILKLLIAFSNYFLCLVPRELRVYLLLILSWFVSLCSL